MQNQNSFFQPNHIEISIKNISQFRDVFLEFIQSQWSHFAENLSQESIPIGFEKRQNINILVIGTSHSMWSNEIEWKKNEIISKINELTSLFNFSITDFSYQIIQKVHEKSELNNYTSSKKDIQKEIARNPLNKVVEPRMLAQIDKITDDKLKKSLLEIAKHLK